MPGIGALAWGRWWRRAFARSSPSWRAPVTRWCQRSRFGVFGSSFLALKVVGERGGEFGDAAGVGAAEPV